MDTLILQQSICINASPEIVWEVLTNPHIIKKYMYGTKIKSTWIPGCPIEWIGEEDGKEVVYVKGKIIEVIPQKSLRIIIYNPHFENEESKDFLDLAYELSFSNRETELTISEGDFAHVKNGQKRYSETILGWKEVLPKIKEIAESR